MADISFGAVGAALIAAVVSVIGLILGKEQKTSEFRQAWIDALRAELVEFLAQAASIRNKVTIDYENHKDKIVAVAEHYTELNKASHGIKLRLNSAEDESKAVLAALSQFEELFRNDDDIVSDRFTIIEGDMLSKSQVLLKKEWKRVKKGEFAYWFTKWLAIIVTVSLSAALIYATVHSLGHSTSSPDGRQHNTTLPPGSPGVVQTCSEVLKAKSACKSQAPVATEAGKAEH